MTVHRQRISIFYLFAVIVIASAVVVAKVNAQVGNTKTTSLHETEASDEAESSRITVEGTVLACSPLQGVFWLTDRGTSIAVCGTDVGALKTGHRVRVRGTRHQERGWSSIEADKVTVLGSGDELPPPAHLSLADIKLSRRDGEWVKISDTVIEAMVVETQSTTLICKQGEHRIRCELPTALSNERLVEWVLATVELTGNLQLERGGEGPAEVSLVGVESKVSVTSPSNTPLQLRPRSDVNLIWEQQRQRYFRAQGQITYFCAAGMFVQDRSGGTWFDLPFAVSSLEPGCTVELIGHRLPGGVGSNLETRVIRIGAREQLSRPKATPIEEFATDELESTRVRTRGTLESYRFRDGLAELILRNEDARFQVCIPTTERKLATLDLATAIEIDVAGTVTFAFSPGEGRELDFRICTPSISELEVIYRKTLLGNQWIQHVFVAGAFAVGLCLLWVQKYRRLDAKKGRDLESLTAQLRSSYDSIRDGIVIVDRNQRILTANQKARDFFGVSLTNGESSERFEETLVSSGSSVRFVENWRDMNRNFSDSLEYELEVVVPRARMLEVFTSPVMNSQNESVARLWAFYDVTERIRLRDSLLQSQKQEAIGRLAAGIAHDFNNLLTGITGNLFVARMNESKTIGEMSESLDAADGAAQRAAKLVSSLLGFSRKARLEMQVCNANTIIRRMEPLLRPSIPPTIQLKFNLEPDLPAVLADPVQLEQVLLNICLNARDAISDIKESSGEIMVHTHPISIFEQPCITICIRDNGCGIPMAEQGKVFEPFFTMKGGNGTGLGLAMSEGIVHQHNGKIDFESVSGEGSEFRVILPATNRMAPESAGSLPKESSDSSLEGKHAMVVDDDGVVRSVITRVLESEKMVVHTASSGDKAIELMSEMEAANISVVLLDWKMPGMSGKETLGWLKRNHPSLPVAVCSGYVFDCNAELSDSQLASDVVIQKPFTGARIIEEVRQLLHAGPKSVEV